MVEMLEIKGILRKIGFCENQIDEMTKISDGDKLWGIVLNEDDFTSDINILLEMNVSYELITEILCSKLNEDFVLFNCYRTGDFRELLDYRNPYRYYNLYCLIEDTNSDGRAMTFIERVERNGFRVAWFNEITEGDLLNDDFYNYQSLFDFCIKQEVALEFYFNVEIENAINENRGVKSERLLPVAFADSIKDNPKHLLVMNEENQYLIKHIETEIYGVKFLGYQDACYMRKIKWKNTLRGMFQL